MFVKVRSILYGLGGSGDPTRRRFTQRIRSGGASWASALVKNWHQTWQQTWHQTRNSMAIFILGLDVREGSSVFLMVRYRPPSDGVLVERNQIIADVMLRGNSVTMIVGQAASLHQNVEQAASLHQNVGQAAS